MPRVYTFLAVVLGVLSWMTNAACLGQTTINCERVDTDNQRIGTLRIQTQVSSASSPFAAADNSQLFLDEDELYVSWGDSVNATANANTADSSMLIVGENMTGWGDTVAVPQITLEMGGNVAATASASDANGLAVARWAMAPEDGFLEIPTVVTGSYEVLGSNQSGTLYGTMDIIISFNGSGDWDFQDEGDTAEWFIRCGSSNLTGNRNGDNDGWNVTGTLYSGGTPVGVNAFWPDNVNDVILVDEGVSSGSVRNLRIEIPSIDLICRADNDGPTQSGIQPAFTFSSSFEVED